jgi:hypothetical protein
MPPLGARIGASLLGAGVAGAWGFGYLRSPWSRGSDALAPHEVYPDPFYTPDDFKPSVPTEMNALITMIAHEGLALKALDLRGTCLSRPPIIKALAAHCPRLEEVRLFETLGTISDEMIATLALNCQFIRLLDLCHMGGRLTDEGLKATYEFCKDLESVRISSCGFDEGVTGASLDFMIKHRGPQLRHLEYSEDIRLKDENLLNIAKSCSKLELLNVQAGFSDITDAGVIEVLKGCKELQQLDVGGMNNVTETTLAHLAEPTFAPKLKVLKVTPQKLGGRVTDSSIADLRLLRPSLHVYTVDPNRTERVFGGAVWR